MKFVLFFALALSAVLASAKPHYASYDAVYVQHIPRDMIEEYEGRALYISTATLQEQVNIVASAHKHPHEVIAALVAACTRHEMIKTRMPNTDVDVDTHLFLFNNDDALILPYTRIRSGPPIVPDVTYEEENEEEEEEEEEEVVRVPVSKKKSKKRSPQKPQKMGSFGATE